MESVMTTSTPTAVYVNLIILEQTVRQRLTILLGINVKKNGEIHFKISKYQKERMVNTWFSLLMSIVHAFLVFW